MILKYAVAWIPLVAIAILNGTIRTLGYEKYIGELRAHQVSTLTAILFSGLYIWGLSLVWPLDSTPQAVAVGLMWLGFTVTFEFLFGHYVVKHPWSRLFRDYNILKGRIWILLLIWIAVAPYLFHRWGPEIPVPHGSVTGGLG